MNSTIFFLALAVITLTACQQDLNIETNNSEGYALFTATTESPATKTTLSKNGEGYDVLWQEGDQITIVDGASNVGVYKTASTTTKGAFSYVSGTIATTPDYKAWYPASIYNADTPTLPSTQEYAADNIKNSPMYAESSTETLSFKNICGIIRLKISTTVSGKKVRSIALSATQPMSGAISNAANLANNSYIAEISEGAGVTLDCGKSGVAIGTEPTAFHFAVPAKSYTGLKITVLTTDGDFQTRTLKSDKSIVVDRSSIANITISFNGFNNNLVQYWPFDGNANNAVSGGVNAIVEGATLTTDRFGNANSAYYFDGDGDNMNADGAAGFGTNSFTASLWVWSDFTTTGSYLGNLLRTDDGYSTGGFIMNFHNTGTLGIWEGRKPMYSFATDSNYANGKWYMVTYVRDAEKKVGQLYIDGTFIGSYTITGNINSVPARLRFGTYGSSEYYKGKMDDIRLYNRALTAEEIAALYVL